MRKRLSLIIVCGALLIALIFSANTLHFAFANSPYNEGWNNGYSHTQEKCLGTKETRPDDNTTRHHVSEYAKGYRDGSQAAYNDFCNKRFGSEKAVSPDLQESLRPMLTQ